MDAALPDYQEAEDYYEGDVGEVFANATLAAKIASTGERYRFALASIPVEMLADRIELVSVQAGDQTADDIIAAVSKGNRLSVRIPDLILKTLMLGDSYLQVWPIEEGGPLPPGLAGRNLAAAGVEVSVIGPKHCRMFYDEESEQQPVYLIKRWQVRAKGERVWRADVHYPDVVERYISLPGKKPTDPDAWLPYGGDDPQTDEEESDWEIPTPTGDQIAFFHFRTGLPYGRPVHRRAYGPQDATTKMLITQLTTTDSHGWPQRWRLVEAGAELDNASDDPDWEDDADAADSGSIRGGVSSGQRSGPGTLQTFTGTKEVGQFEAADPGVFLDPAELYVRLMAQLTRVPLHYFDPRGGVPSGQSLRVADAPLVKQAKHLRDLIEGAIQEFWDYVLRVRGVEATKEVTVGWASPESDTGLDDWEEVNLKQQVGVPIPVTLVEAGYPQETVDSWDLPDHPVDQQPLPALPDLTGAPGGE
jgi:hypothetical protein